MSFRVPEPDVIYLSMTDVDEPLATHSRYGFYLDDAEWPSLEHYYQGMKFEDPVIRETVRSASHPKAARAIAKRNKRKIRRDWKSIKRTVMTRGAYIRCRANPEVAEKLLATGVRPLVENSQYDYYWGCGRDMRGENAYGNLLMQVREKLRELEAGREN